MFKVAKRNPNPVLRSYTPSTPVGKRNNIGGGGPRLLYFIAESLEDDNILLVMTKNAPRDATVNLKAKLHVSIANVNIERHPLLGLLPIGISLTS